MPARAMCARCLRAEVACICQWITPVVSTVELLILQHPLEVGNAKNSARLLHLSAAGSVMEVGETFDPAVLAGWLEEGGRTPVLLYPDTPGDASLGIAPPPALDLAGSHHIRLVVIDATWRKSRKMLYLNPALQRLPRLTLRAVPPSRYRIRKAHGPDQLSTLEASVHALAQLDAAMSGSDALLDAFDGFVSQQAQWRP